MRAAAPRGDRIVRKWVWKLWCMYVEGERLEREVRGRVAMTWQRVQGWMQEG